MNVYLREALYTLVYLTDKINSHLILFTFKGHTTTKCSVCFIWSKDCCSAAEQRWPLSALLLSSCTVKWEPSERAPGWTVMMSCTGSACVPPAQVPVCSVTTPTPSHSAVAVNRSLTGEHHYLALVTTETLAVAVPEAERVTHPPASRKTASVSLMLVALLRTTLHNRCWWMSLEQEALGSKTQLMTARRMPIQWSWLLSFMELLGVECLREILLTGMKMMSVLVHKRVRSGRSWVTAAKRRRTQLLSML